MEQIANKPAETRDARMAQQRSVHKNPQPLRAGGAARKMYPPTHGRSISEDIAEYLSVMQRPPRRRWRDN